MTSPTMASELLWKVEENLTLTTLGEVDSVTESMHDHVHSFSEEV